MQYSSSNLVCWCRKCANVFQEGMVIVVFMGDRQGRGHTFISTTYPNTYIVTQTHGSPTNTVTQSTWTAPWRVPLQLPPLYYWSIWRLLSQGWHGLGDVTAQPINTTLKAQDPQSVCTHVCVCVCARAGVCVYACDLLKAAAAVAGLYPSDLFTGQ